MKKFFKIFVVTLLLFTFIAMYKNNLETVNAQTRLNVQFSISDKVYDGTPVSDISVTFTDGNNNIVELTSEDYIITYKAVGQILNSAPYVPNRYSAEISSDNPLYEFWDSCTFDIEYAESFIINITDITIIEGARLKSPEYTIIGNCYDNLLPEFYIVIDGERVPFKDVTTSMLTVGKYDIEMEHSYLPYYNDIIVNKGIYYVNRQELTCDNDNTITVKKAEGIDSDYKLKSVTNQSYIDLFDGTFTVVKSFDLFFESENNNSMVTEATITIDLNGLNSDKLKVYSVTDNNIAERKFVYNNGKIIFETNDNSSVVLVYQKQKITLYVITIIIFVLCVVEIIISVKVFGLGNKKLLGICAPVFMLYYFDSVDIFLFIFSLWIFVLCTIITIDSYILYSKRKKQALIDMMPDKEDMELFDYLVKSKSYEEYELEEITEEHTSDK